MEIRNKNYDLIFIEIKNLKNQIIYKQKREWKILKCWHYELNDRRFEYDI